MSTILCGDGVTDNTAALNAALALGGEIKLSGNFLISGQVTLPASSALIGSAEHTTITTTGGGYVSFRIAGSNVTVANLTIQNTAKTSGADFMLDTTFGDVIQVRLENVVSYCGFGLWADTGTGTNAYYLVWLINCTARLLRGIGYSFTRACAFLYVEDCTADYVGSTSANYAGFAIDASALAGRSAVGGAFFRQCAVNGTSGAGSHPNQTGYSIVNFSNVWMTNCDADTCDGFGYAFNAVNHLNVTGCEAGLCNNAGIVLVNCGWGQFGTNKVYGRQGQPGAASSVHGVFMLEGNQCLTFNGNQVMYCTGDGFNAPAQSGPINLSGDIVSACGGYGIATSGAFGFLASGVTLVGNAAGNYFLGSATHYLQTSMLNSGAVVSIVGPAAG